MRKEGQRAFIILGQIIYLFFLSVTFANNNSHDTTRPFKFPDIPGYVTVKCDFHQHTVFSDGSVWPNIRVQEAIKDGVDAISITDHIEYQPHNEDIPHPDRNRGYDIAAKEAKGKDLIIIKGAEITRKMPPGHANAIFLNDVNELLKDNVIDVFKEAKNQGAFTFWNHPNWISQKADGIAELTEMHKQLIKEGLLKGIEIVNEHTYSEEALQIAIDNNLTIMGTSDIHGLIDWEFDVNEGGHRPLTLVFSTNKTVEAIKIAMERGRTAVFFNNTLIGNSEFIVPLIRNSLFINKIDTLSNSEGEPVIKSIHIKNLSSMDFILKNKSDFSFHSHSGTIIFKANETTVLDIKTVEPFNQFILRFEVLNAFISPKVHPEIKLEIKNSTK